MAEIFHHALKIVTDRCVGCTLCMNVCPTHAIRVKNGTAILIGNRCIDCGECYRICPVNAIMIEQDDFNKIYDYTYRVALVPSVLLGQFPTNISTEKIYSVLIELGFTHVINLEHGAEILKTAYKHEIRQNDFRPVISSFCPAIVRLIQVKFPSLVNNFLLVKPPLDISAIYMRHMLEQNGAKAEEIGVFHITPCAAKIAAIKSPAEGEKSPITGVINLDSIYSLILQKIKQNKSDYCAIPEDTTLSAMGILWSLTHGEADNVNGKKIAIDGIQNVMSFLEKLENGQTDHFDFLELRACDESCAGGVLTTTNRFLTVERLRKKSSKIKEKCYKNKKANTIKINEYKDFLIKNISIPRIKPRSIMKLDEDMNEAMRKMKIIRDLMKILPQVECGLCGSPGCRVFAEDISQGFSKLEQCIFIQKRFEANGSFKPEESHQILREIWGNEILEDQKPEQTNEQ